MTVFGYDLAELAANAGYVLTIGSLLSIIIKNLIIKPFEQKRLKEQKESEQRQNEFQRQIFDKVSENLKPIQEAIDQLNYMLADSQRDQSELHDIIDERKQLWKDHDDKLDDHEKRIFVLERNGHKINYREEHR